MNSDDDLFASPPKPPKVAERAAKNAAAKQRKRSKKSIGSSEPRSNSPEMAPELDMGHPHKDAASVPIPISVQIAAEEFKARPNQTSFIHLGPEEPLDLRSAPGGQPLL